MKSVVPKAFEKVVKQLAKAEQKEIKKKYIHPISLIKILLQPDFLAIMAIMSYNHSLALKKRFKHIKAEQLFILQYLYKCGFASPAEIRYMMFKSFNGRPARVDMQYITKNGLIERETIEMGSKKKAKMLVITQKGRDFVETIGNKEVVRNLLNNYREVHKPRQQLFYKQKKQYAKKNPELKLMER